MTGDETVDRRIRGAASHRALVTLIPHTTSPRQSRFEASVVSFLRAGVFDAQNIITIPHAKPVRLLGALGPGQFETVERATQLWLGLVAPGPLTGSRRRPVAF